VYCGRWIYSQVRMDDRLCLLVIIGVTEHGHKELVAVSDGYRESSASWKNCSQACDKEALPIHQNCLLVMARLAFGMRLVKFTRTLVINVVGT